MTQTQTTWEADLAAHHLTAVRRFVRRQNRWFRHCAAFSADPTQPYNVRLMPSKAAKHRAYDAAAQACRLLGRDDRPHTFPELCALVGEPCDLVVK
jgi:hypothetical protein